MELVLAFVAGLLLIVVLFLSALLLDRRDRVRLLARDRSRWVGRCVAAQTQLAKAKTLLSWLNSDRNRILKERSLLEKRLTDSEAKYGALVKGLEDDIELQHMSYKEIDHESNTSFIAGRNSALDALSYKLGQLTKEVS